MTPDLATLDPAGLVLDVADPREQRTERSLTSTARGASLKARVVVVDDDDATRSLVAAILDARGFAVETFPDAASGGERLDVGRVDLLVVDVGLPDGCGLDLIARARDDDGEQVPAIVLSARHTERDIVRGFDAGAVDYMGKPFSPDELVARCTVHLARRGRADPPRPRPGELPTSGGLVFGRYRIERLLGQGGYSRVYLARDERRGGARVALKVLAPLASSSAEHRARFTRETYTLSSLHHPRVARVHDAGAAQGRLFLAMEFVPGTSLQEHVAAAGPIAEDDAAALARGLLDAVAAIEEIGVVHRDLKPANVMLREGRIDDPVLIDFGLAKRPFDRGVTAAHVLMGTPGFIAPEVARGRDPDARTDLFGVGLCVRFALAGEPLFPDLEGVDLLTAIARGPLPPLDRPLGPGLVRLLAGLLAIAPPRRPASAADALALLAAGAPDRA